MGYQTPIHHHHHHHHHHRHRRHHHHHYHLNLNTEKNVSLYINAKKMCLLPYETLNHKHCINKNAYFPDPQSRLLHNRRQISGFLVGLL